MKWMPFAILFLFCSCAYAQPTPLELHILADGNARFGDGPELSEDRFLAEIRKLMRKKPRPLIRVVPDRTARYDVVAKMLADLMRLDYGPHLGFTGIETR